jgi:hypothetical protein
MQPFPSLTREQRRQGITCLMGVTLPENETLLHRIEVTAKLRVKGFPIGERTLLKLATRGEGPPVYKFGRVPLYRWAEVLAWAQSRLTVEPNQLAEMPKRYLAAGDDASTGTAVWRRPATRTIRHECCRH